MQISVDMDDVCLPPSMEGIIGHLKFDPAKKPTMAVEATGTPERFDRVRFFAERDC